MAQKNEKKIVDTSVRKYLEGLKARACKIGSGTASALAGAQGLCLVMLVCETTIGKVKYESCQDICIRCKDRAEGLYIEMLELIDEDADATALMCSAGQLPTASEEEKVAKKAALADASRMATAIPYRIMELCIEGMKLAEDLFGNSNPTSSQMLGSAALNLLSGAQGAWLNVKAHLPGVTDAGMVKAFREDGRKMYDLSEMMCIKLYDGIAKSLEDIE